METSSGINERSLSRAIALARNALGHFPSCFWTRAPTAPLETRDDVLLVVRHLKRRGSSSAWRAAVEIERCL